MNDLAGDSAEQAAVHALLMAQQHERNTREVTRLLCSQAYLGGADFRASVLDFYAQNDDAVAPELGVDARLVTQVCLAARSNGRTYDLIFAGIAIAGIFAWLFGYGSLLPLVVVIAVVVYAVRDAGIDQQVANFTKGRFDFNACTRQYAGVAIPPAIAAALPRDDQNLVMYRDQMPFVGAGYLDGGWSFNCSLDHAESGKPITTFTVTELYAHIEAALSRLGLPSLQCEHQLMVRGSEVRSQPELFNAAELRPVQRVPEAMMNACMQACDERMRHYLCIRIADWGGEVITTFYLRFVVQGNGLYVDSSRFFLGPLREEFRAIDKLHILTPAARIGMLTAALFLAPLTAVLALLSQFSRITQPLHDRSRRRRRRDRLAREPNYNFGASRSVRMMASDTSFKSYFQLSDVDFNRKLIERNLLDEIGNFLQAHGIDDSDVRERRTTILNNGVLVQGGNIQAGALAVGHGATANSGHGIPGA